MVAPRSESRETEEPLAQGLGQSRYRPEGALDTTTDPSSFPVYLFVVRPLPLLHRTPARLVPENQVRGTILYWKGGRENPPRRPLPYTRPPSGTDTYYPPYPDDASPPEQEQ